MREIALDNDIAIVVAPTREADQAIDYGVGTPEAGRAPDDGGTTPELGDTLDTGSTPSGGNDVIAGQEHTQAL